LRSLGRFVTRAVWSPVRLVHDFDMTRYLLGDEVAAVYAFGGCVIQVGAEDARIVLGSPRERAHFAWRRGGPSSRETGRVRG
jgi:predicted dehydrogenase